VRRLSLRTKILLGASLTLVTVIGAALAYVGVQANHFVGERLAADLERGRDLIATAEAERFASLQLTSEVIASFPQLRALLETTDAATIREFLLDYRQRTRRTDLLIVLAPDGRTVARTDALDAAGIQDVDEQWIQPVLAGQPAVGYLTLETGVYQSAAAVAEVAGTVFGYLLAGARVDDAFAQQLRNATSEDVVIVSARGLLGSTIPVQHLPWRTTDEWERSSGGHTGQVAVTIAGEEYAARGWLGSNASVAYVTLQSRDRALAPYRRIQYGLLAIGVLVVAAGVGASALLARTITAPVARLVEGTQQVAAGNFDFALSVESEDELGALARSFNDMTRGLRERADMQKFVSQSTLEMIRTRASTGERKRLTMLYSDVRGFSGFAEQRPPEQAVEWLNKCLGIQADLVRKHHGDVDKFVGDAVFALFDGEDMAWDAVRCAVAIQRHVETLVVPDADPLEIGIGIVTGDVILGSIGSQERLDYTAVGNQVNLCARLCTMAAPREILIADSTYALVRDLVAAERLEAVSIRGLARPVDVYRVVIAREAPAPRAAV
jgi:class 3 adenylate cyclase